MDKQMKKNIHEAEQAFRNYLEEILKEAGELQTNLASKAAREVIIDRIIYGKTK